MPQSGRFIIQLPRRLLRVYWLGYLTGSAFWERVSGASSLVCTGLNDCSRSNDPKEAWTLVNTLLGKNNKPNNLSELSVNDNLVSDPKSMAVALNDYFVNIGPALAAEYEEESCNISQTTRLVCVFDLNKVYLPTHKLVNGFSDSYRNLSKQMTFKGNVRPWHEIIVHHL